MSTKTIDLEALEAERQEKLAAVEKEFEARKQQAFEALKNQLNEAVKALAKVYYSLPTELRGGQLLAELTDNGMLKEMSRPVGVTRTKSAGGGKGRGRVSEEKLLAFLATERSTPDICNHFNMTNPSQRLNALQKAGKIKMRDDGKKYWKRA